MIDRVQCDPQFDVAIAQLNGRPYDEYLLLAPADDLTMNCGVLTPEYNATSGSPMPNGRTAMSTFAGWYQSHMVQAYVTEFGHQRPAR